MGVLKKLLKASERSLNWGKLVSTAGTLASTLGVNNPYRYRSYRYDTETGLYYLQSRYYNPDMGRFINADSAGVLGMVQGQLLTANLFSYCGNNPVMNSDPSGQWNWVTSWGHIWNAIKDIGNALIIIASFSVEGSSLYKGATFVAKIASRVIYNVMALQLDAALLSTAVVAQQYPEAVALLAFLITLAITIPVATLTSNLKDASNEIKLAIYA